MNTALVDRLVCPRCGPPFGLIVLADEMRERHVVEGTLGCANCRDGYPVRGGFADLRPAPRRPTSPEPGLASPDALQVAAALGVTSGPAILLLIGSAAGSAPEVAALIKDVQIVAMGSRSEEMTERVTTLIAAPRLPFHDRALRGMAMDLSQVERWAPEAARVLASGSHVVVFGARGGDAPGGEDRGGPQSSNPADLQALGQVGFDVRQAAPGVHVGVRRPG